MPDNTNNYVQTIGLDFTDAVKNAQLFDKTLADVGNKLISFQKTIDTVNNKTKTIFTMETGSGEIKKIISDLETGIKSITTTTNVMKKSVSEINALYAQQKNLETERAALNKRRLSASGDETKAIIERINHLNKEIATIEGKRKGELKGYQNAEKEAAIKAREAKYTSELAQAQARVNDELRKRASLENISDVNALYAKQKNMETELAALNKRRLSSSGHESKAIIERIGYLKEEIATIEGKIKTEFSGYRNAEKEAAIEASKVKYTSELAQAQARINDELLKRASLESTSDVNALYAKQENLIAERVALKKTGLSSSENEANVIRRRIEYLDEEYAKIQKKIETQFNGYRNAEKEAAIKASEVKYASELEQAEARVNDRLKERVSFILS